VEREVLEPDRGSSPTAARSVSVIGTLRLSPFFVMRLPGAREDLTLAHELLRGSHLD
jgi:hypothetical protein